MFENGMGATLGAFALMGLQALWWWRLLKKPTATVDNNRLQVLYASQSGHAQNLAEQTAEQLAQVGQLGAVCHLNDWLQQQTNRTRAARLAALNGKTVLFVVSTQGDGDPPDNAVAFFRQLGTWHGDLSDLRFAVLGLGDSRYPHFCGFAHHLRQRLQQLGGKPLFDTVTVDNLNDEDLSHWQQAVRTHFAATIHYDSRQSLCCAVLQDRYQENGNSPAPPLFMLRLSLSESAIWQAGDIAEINIPVNNPDADSEPLRSYTLANVPTETDGRTLQLLVRQVKKDNGELGIGSGYLTDTLQVGEHINLSIRHNPRFHLPDTPTPLILIATGSGLAGILAVLQHAEQDWGISPSHHLIYGERYADTDTPCREQLNHYQNSGLLGRVDYCFSRAEGKYRYVQDALHDQADHIKALIKQGAMVYVCGSKNALGESIPDTLKPILGNSDYQTLIARKRLRFDVY